MNLIKSIFFIIGCLCFNVLNGQSIFQEDFDAVGFPSGWNISSRVEKAVALGKENSGYIRFHPRFQQQIIESPLIPATSGNHLLRFDWNKAGNSSADSVYVELSNNIGNSWQVIYAIYNGNNRNWQTDSVSISNTGSSLIIRWRYFSGSIFPAQYFNLDNVKIERATATYLHHNTTDINFSVFPNPNEGEFQIKINNPLLKPGNLTILDIEGTEIYQQQIPLIQQFLIQIQQPSLSKGTYIIQLHTAPEVITKKISIQ